MFTFGSDSGNARGATSRAERDMEGNIAVFSHGHFLRVLATRWIRLPIIEALRFLLSTASVSILSYEHNNSAEPVLALWNERRRVEPEYKS